MYTTNALGFRLRSSRVFLAIKQIGTESVRSHVWGTSLLRWWNVRLQILTRGSQGVAPFFLRCHKLATPTDWSRFVLCPLHFYLGVCKTPSTRRYSINWNGIKRLFRNPWQLINHRDSQVPYFSNPQFPLSVLANLQTTARQHKINVMNGCRKVKHPMSFPVAIFLVTK